METNVRVEVNEPCGEYDVPYPTNAHGIYFQNRNTVARTGPWDHVSVGMTMIALPAYDKRQIDPSSPVRLHSPESDACMHTTVVRVSLQCGPS